MLERLAIPQPITGLTGHKLIVNVNTTNINTTNYIDNNSLDRFLRAEARENRIPVLNASSFRSKSKDAMYGDLADGGQEPVYRQMGSEEVLVNTDYQLEGDVDRYLGGGPYTNISS